MPTLKKNPQANGFHIDSPLWSGYQTCEPMHHDQGFRRPSEQLGHCNVITWC